jgi:hypothetical protein
MQFLIGDGYAIAPGSADGLAAILRDATGREPQRAPLTPLAGPNEAIQILLDPVGWGILGAALAMRAVKPIWDAALTEIGTEVGAAIVRRVKDRVFPGQETVELASQDKLADGIARFALEHKDRQTLVLGIPVLQTVARNAGVEVSRLMTGDPRADRITLFRAAVALLEIGGRLPSHSQFFAQGPQNPDCSLAITLNDDGGFGGTFDYYAREWPPGLTPEIAAQAGYVEPGRYQVRLIFDKDGACVANDMVRVGGLYGGT